MKNPFTLVMINYIQTGPVCSTIQVMSIHANDNYNFFDVLTPENVVVICFPYMYCSFHTQLTQYCM